MEDLSAEKFTTSSTTDNSLSPSIKWSGNLHFCLELKESWLKQKNATYKPSNRITVFTVYELDTWSQNLNFDFTLKGCLFGGTKLATNADSDIYMCIMVLVLDLICVHNFYYLMVA